MSGTRPQFSIDDAFELTLEDAGPGPESSGVARFGPLHFERRARFEVADEDKQSRLRYQREVKRPKPSNLSEPCVLVQNLENDEDGAQASPESDGGVSTSWTQHPLIQKNRRVVLASFLLLLLGLVLILVGVGLEVAPSPGVSSAIFFVPGFLLLVPGVYHVIFICCAVKGHRGFQFFYLPYFEK
ncbi:transmembrane protein 134 isoform X4 [Cricetulus griseus]|uniref:Transmembrane protein 134 isoform X12 n=1 Tax=Cricetulus griseus TaxID=10029 RepID=A0A9J7FTE8_CRIGR|nr:transmembrane protein 134 isoform X12 [Cricetulus griseus]XP_035316690.1 transmembrane protein 134 isoform X4 [Cricetulus griseus]